jgi:hypothetical protein
VAAVDLADGQRGAVARDGQPLVESRTRQRDLVREQGTVGDADLEVGGKPRGASTDRRSATVSVRRRTVVPVSELASEPMSQREREASPERRRGVR